MKTAKTFRLSEQAVKQLQALKEKTGTNETAIIEIALALFENEIFGAIKGSPSVNSTPGNLAWEMGMETPVQINRKKRKRN